MTSFFTRNTNTSIEINALLFPTLYTTRQVFLIILRKSRTLCNFVSLILLKRWYVTSNREYFLIIIVPFWFNPTNSFCWKYNSIKKTQYYTYGRKNSFRYFQYYYSLIRWLNWRCNRNIFFNHSNNIGHILRMLVEIPFSKYVLHVHAYNCRFNEK